MLSVLNKKQEILSGDISWLLDPHIQALFMQFPLPLAILGDDGHIRQLNHCFNATFSAECLGPENVQKILQAANAPTHGPLSFQCEPCATEIFVRVVKVSDSTILVLEKSVENIYSDELAALRQRVLELEKISVSDRLTGVWNRAYFDRIIAVEMARSLRYHQPASLIFFDIDHFKQVNDTLGHAAGDAVLCELVNVVNANIRVSDMLFRWGGEEFVILATSTPYRAANTLAEALRRTIAGHTIAGVGQVTVSLGVAECVPDESAACWFKRADAALYAAKNSGRNRVVMDAQGSSDLWTSIPENSVALHLHWHESYNCGQPTIDAEHRKLFKLANILIGAAFTRREKPQAFAQALENLLAHTVKHFADEEALLAQYHYAELALHSQAHERLIGRALQLRDNAFAKGVTVGELVDFLADEVVAQHMLKMDRKFYPLFDNPPPTA
jgi:diguanylate cyclase (GGDEF)-like protein/hemerythrin-like metal-binding protein